MLDVDKPPNFEPFTFFHLEIEKSPPYVGDIWVLTLPIHSNGSMKILTPGLETWFQPGDRLIRIEHVSVMS